MTRIAIVEEAAQFLSSVLLLTTPSTESLARLARKVAIRRNGELVREQMLVRDSGLRDTDIEIKVDRVLNWEFAWPLIVVNREIRLG